MSAPRELLDRVLGPTGEDAGCERTLEVLDEYVEHEVAGRLAATLLPHVARHLAACPDCGGDGRALLDALRMQELGSAGDGSVAPGEDGVDGVS